MAGITIPFEGAAHKDYRELIYSTTVQPGAALVDISPPGGKIKPYGYLRELEIEVIGAGGSAGGTLAADGPWNLFSTLQVTLPNGQELYGDSNWNGYHAYLAAKHSAHMLNNDPSTWQTYSSTAANPAFLLPVPFELNSQYGWGALPNTDDSAPYKLKMVANTSTNIWATVPTTTIPTFTVNIYEHCWTIPEPVNRLTGDQQIVAPVGLGTLQKWSRQFYSVTASAAQAISLTRKGNIVKQMIFILRNSSGARIATSMYPNPFAFIWDGVPLKPSDKCALAVNDYERSAGGESGGFTVAANVQDTGVLPLKFSYPGGIDCIAQGDGLGQANFIGTVQSSRLELSGTWGSTAAQLEVLTNDIVVTDLTGSPYSFGYSPQLMSPTSPPTAT